MVGTRDPKKAMANTTVGPMGQQPLSTWAKANPKAKIGTMADAAKHGELVVLAVHGTAVEDAVKAAGPANLAGKTVLETANPLEFTPNGLHWAKAVKDSCLQTAQRAAPKANFVKAWNTIPGAQMVDPKFKEGIGDQLICGNDAKAKEQAAKILKEFGWNSLDAGDASVAPYIEATALAICNFALKSNDWTWGVKLVRQAPAPAKAAAKK